MLNIFGHLQTLARHHELLASMIYRQIYARYRQSVLGIAWTFVRPVATVTIFTVVFSVIAKFPSDNIPYPLFAFGALLPWTLFNTALGAGIPSLTGQANLVSKIYFPREILPLSAIAASALDFFVALLLFVGMMIFYQVALTWNVFYVLPILFIEILFIIGMTLLLSMVNVWYRDVTHAIGLVLQLWMYLTPIIYPYSMVPEQYRNFYSLNPLVGIVEAFRTAVIKGEPPDIRLLSISFVIGLFTFLIGYGIFKAREFDFADVI